MKIKLDENLPNALTRVLLSMGHDTETVHDEGLVGQDDDAVWRAAQSEGRFLITQDLDFSDVREFAPGTHAGLLLVRLREPGRRALTELVGEAFASRDIESWSACFVVMTERKIRVLRPEGQ